MALALSPTSSSRIQVQTNRPLRLRRQDPAGVLGFGVRNTNSSFYKEVHSRISYRNSKRTATRGKITMMSFGIPRVRYRNPMEGIDTFVDLYTALQKERIIFIDDAIDEESSNQIVATLLYLDGADSSKEICFFINSEGGDISPCMAIYDTMQYLKSPVSTKCISYAFDIAGFILAAGKKGNRVALPHCQIMLQSPAGEFDGQADFVLNETNELLRLRDHLFRELAKQTGQPEEKIYKDLRQAKRFYAQEAIEYGLIDRIIRPPPITAK